MTDYRVQMPLKQKKIQSQLRKIHICPILCKYCCDYSRTLFRTIIWKMVEKAVCVGNTHTHTSMLTGCSGKHCAKCTIPVC